MRTHKKLKKFLSTVLTMAMVSCILMTMQVTTSAAVCSNYNHASVLATNTVTLNKASDFSASWGMKWLADIRWRGTYVGEVHGQYQRNTFLGIVTSRKVLARSALISHGYHREAWVFSGSAGNGIRTGCVSLVAATTSSYNLSDNIAHFRGDVRA